MDIPLVIRGFGETIPVKSVEEALQKFVQPEVLDKDNQYNCEKCAKKVLFIFITQERRGNSGRDDSGEVFN